MKAITFIAVAAMTMWMSDAGNAQQNSTQNNQEKTPQVDGEKGARGQRGKGQRGQGREGRQGNRRRGQGMQGNRAQGQRGGAQMLEGLFNRFDKDKSGSISLAEAPDRMKQRFEKLDTNGDKSVSKEELQAALANRGEGRQGRGGKDGAGKGKGKDGAGKGSKGGRGQSMMDPSKMIERVDKNNDGVISADEAPEKMKQRFDRIDADSSGTISVDELKAAFEKIQNGGRGGKGAKGSKGGKGGKRKGKNGQIGRDKSANPDATKPVKPKRPAMADGGA